MIIDGRTIENGSKLGCDVCIVGAGPAGLATASELMDRGLRIVVVESGGFAQDATTEALSACTVEDNDDLYPDPRHARTRRALLSAMRACAWRAARPRSGTSTWPERCTST